MSRARRLWQTFERGWYAYREWALAGPVRRHVLTCGLYPLAAWAQRRQERRSDAEPRRLLAVYARPWRDDEVLDDSDRRRQDRR